MNCTKPVKLANGMSVPCGWCLICRIAKASEWAVRMYHEMASHTKCLFVTLTYDDEHLPADKGVNKTELAECIKRLRKHSDAKIRYYGCGEYGEREGRPHYHLIIYGIGIEDHKMNGKYCIGGPLFKAWQSRGNIYLGSVTYDSARYVADYIQQKKTWKYKGDGRTEPFQVFSQGLGREYCDANIEKIREGNIESIRKKRKGIPKYYKKRAEVNAGILYKQRIEKENEVAEYWRERGITRFEINGAFCPEREEYTEKIKEALISNEKTIEAKRKLKERIL